MLSIENPGSSARGQPMWEAPTQPCSRHLQLLPVSSSSSHHWAPNHQGGNPTASTTPHPPPSSAAGPLPAHTSPALDLPIAFFLPARTSTSRSLSLLPLKLDQSVSLPLLSPHPPTSLTPLPTPCLASSLSSLSSASFLVSAPIVLDQRQP